MAWKPAAKVVVNGSDVTGLFLDRLVSLTITDEAGVQSDTAEIILSDHLPLARLQIPPTGGEIAISLGYGFAASLVGLYVAEDVEVSGPPDQIRITAYSASYGSTGGGKSALTDQKTRSWPDGTTVKALVGKIAGECGFEAAVSAAAGDVKPGHLDQINESNMALLTRVARDNGLLFKPGGGKLVMCKEGESTSAGGQPLPVVALGRKQLTSWRMTIKRREAAAKVIATYRDLGAAQTKEVEVTAGGGGDRGPAGVTQTKRLRKIYQSEAAAKQAAQAEAGRASRAGVQLSLTLPGNPELMAEGRLQLTGVRHGVDGLWLIKRVTHQIDSGGWRSSVECELPPS